MQIQQPFTLLLPFPSPFYQTLFRTWALLLGYLEGQCPILSGEKLQKKKGRKNRLSEGKLSNYLWRQGESFDFLCGPVKVRLCFVPCPQFSVSFWFHSVVGVIQITRLVLMAKLFVRSFIFIICCNLILYFLKVIKQSLIY